MYIPRLLVLLHRHTHGPTLFSRAKLGSTGFWRQILCIILFGKGFTKPRANFCRRAHPPVAGPDTTLRSFHVACKLKFLDKLCMLCFFNQFCFKSFVCEVTYKFSLAVCQ